MKKLIALSIILTLSVSLLSGCGAKRVEEDQSDVEWFADEVLDVDDWGKKKKVKPKTDTKSSVKSTIPSKPKSSTKSSTTKKK